MTSSQHLMGFLKNHLASEDKHELLGLIEDYRQDLLPLIVPRTLAKHHLGSNDRDLTRCGTADTICGKCGHTAIASGACA